MSATITPEEQARLNDRARATRERHMDELIAKMSCIRVPVGEDIRQCAACGKSVKNGRWLGTLHICA